MTGNLPRQREMSARLTVRPAHSRELPLIGTLIKKRLLSLAQTGTQAGKIQQMNPEKQLTRLIPDQTLFVARVGQNLVGLAALDLDRGQILACYLDRELGKKQHAVALVQAVEQRALAFGLRRLRIRVNSNTEAFFRKLEYTDGLARAAANETVLERSLLGHAEPWQRDRFRQLDELGIPANYGVRHRLTLVPETDDLVSIGPDIYGRDQRLIPLAAKAWSAMREAALDQGVELQVVSAFRTATYQSGLIRRKMEQGKSMEAILSSSTAPGFSEHHSGRALDLTAPGSTPVEEIFATTEAYHWLRVNAGVFGFRETFPRNNRHGILWEPWHWYYVRNQSS